MPCRFVACPKDLKFRGPDGQDLLSTMLRDGPQQWQASALYHEPNSPPTSGKAFASSVLHRIFPVPEELFRVAADAYLNPLSAMLGPVASLDEVGGRYRMHGSNDSRPRTLNLQKIRADLARRAIVRAKQKELARKLYAMDIPDVPLGDVT